VKVLPVSEAALSPHRMAVSSMSKASTRSVRPSALTSLKTKRAAAASVPVRPKRTVVGDTVVASKPPVARMATEIFPLPLRLSLTLLPERPGSMSIETAVGMAPRNSADKT
jgi:hypothetical protein